MSVVKEVRRNGSYFIVLVMKAIINLLSFGRILCRVNVLAAQGFDFQGVVTLFSFR